MSLKLRLRPGSDLYIGLSEVSMAARGLSFSVENILSGSCTGSGGIDNGHFHSTARRHSCAGVITNMSTPPCSPQSTVSAPSPLRESSPGMSNSHN